MKINDERYQIELEHKAEELRQILRRRGHIVAERAPEDLEETLLVAEREAAALELDRTYRLLRQVDGALTRLRAGDYGSCLKCESLIPEKRLRAVPWAMYCVKCQEQVDRLHEEVSALRRSAA
jgi:DnaK suppressor protein